MYKNQYMDKRLISRLLYEPFAHHLVTTTQHKKLFHEEFIKIQTSKLHASLKHLFSSLSNTNTTISRKIMISVNLYPLAPCSKAFRNISKIPGIDV